MKIKAMLPHLIAVLAIFIVCVGARPQASSGATIEGIVKEAGTENPIAGVKVHTDSTFGPATEAVTDAQGKFSLVNVGSGPQRILTEKA